MELSETFDGPDLDPTIWFPYYLPHWSSRAGSAATFELGSDGLHLSIPDHQPLWCPQLHEEPLRASCVQSGSFSGPAGSPIGQQPFRKGLIVGEEQPIFRGYTPHHGEIGIRMKGTVDAGSMFAFWLSGFEDEPERSGEICVAEIFGDSVDGATAGIGMGFPFRDPVLSEDFVVEQMEIDVNRFHDYAVRWGPDSVVFSVDGTQIRTVRQSPGYPVQLMIGVFDFPSRMDSGTRERVPEMVVRRVWGRPLD